MDLKLEVYTPALELVGMLEIQRSVIWAEKAFSAGSFSLESLITEDTRALLVPENILWIAGDTGGIIEHVEQQAGADGPYITVKGRDLTGIFDRRILWGQYDLHGTPAAIMHQLVNDCAINPTRGDTEARKLPGLVSLAVPVGGEVIRAQKTGGTLLEALEQLGETYQVAFGVRFNAAVPRMEFWTRPGVDRSVNQTTNEPVFYSTELDDVLESEYSYDSSKYRNAALVAGEGEGGQRVMVTVENAVEPEPQPPEPPEPGKTYTITLAVDPEGGGVASGGGTVNEGDSVTVTASPAEGYVFSGWREGTDIVSTQAIYTFQASADRSLTAVFAVIIPTYTISVSVSADQADWGTVSGGGQYQEGEQVTVTASPNEGYQFVAWQVDGQEVSIAASYTFTVDGNRSLVAVFEVVNVSRLPEGYTEVEFIQSSGTQYINTGVKPTSTINVMFDVEPLSSAISTQKIFFGSSYAPTGTKYYFILGWSTSGVRVTTGSTSSAATYKTLSSSTKLRRMMVVVDCLNKKAFIEGETEVSLTSVVGSQSMPAIYLLAFPSGGSSISAKIYSCKIKISEAAVRDFVPCINPSGTVGLYDLVDSKFYGNSGTGTFTAGPAV